MSRLQAKTFDELSPQQQTLFEEIVDNRPVKPVDGNTGGPFDIWLRSPELGKHLVDLGSFFGLRLLSIVVTLSSPSLSQGPIGKHNLNGSHTNPWREKLACRR